MRHGRDLYHILVKCTAVDVDGKLFGVECSNPITDTRIYEVEFADGETEILAVNVITENLLSQVDEEGHRKANIE